MTFLIRLLFTLAAGVALGVGSAFWAVSGQPPFGVARSGPWAAWPGAGGPDADPYARAIFARESRMPLSPVAGLRFLATTDSAGFPLDGRCDYAVGGPTPPAEGWTLTVLDRAGFTTATGGGRAGFTSSEVVRDADGAFTVAVAPEVRPGNWLPSGRGEAFQLMLSLYGTPLGTALRMNGAAPALPAIERRSCP